MHVHKERIGYVPLKLAEQGAAVYDKAAGQNWRKVNLSSVTAMALDRQLYVCFMAQTLHIEVNQLSACLYKH